MEKITALRWHKVRKLFIFGFNPKQEEPKLNTNQRRNNTTPDYAWREIKTNKQHCGRKTQNINFGIFL